MSVLCVVRGQFVLTASGSIFSGGEDGSATFSLEAAQADTVAADSIVMDDAPSTMLSHRLASLHSSRSADAAARGVAVRVSVAQEQGVKDGEIGSMGSSHSGVPSDTHAMPTLIGKSCNFQNIGNQGIFPPGI